MKVLLVALGLTFALTATAQVKDPMNENFFSPELIMANQTAIELTADQKNAIRAIMKESQGEFMDLQWDMEDYSTALMRIISQTRVDETKALAQLEQVLNQEKKIKVKQFSTMIRLKNILTLEQQKKLHELR